MRDEINIRLVSGSQTGNLCQFGREANSRPIASNIIILFDSSSLLVW